MNTIETMSGKDVSATPLPNTASRPPADPLALDPLSPVALRPAGFGATLTPAAPLALDPLGLAIPQPGDH